MVRKSNEKKMSKTIDNDCWLARNFEMIINKYAGGYVLIGNGKVLYTDKNGTPRQLIKRVKTEYPGVTPLFFRVPYPREFLCALATA